MAHGRRYQQVPVPDRRAVHADGTAGNERACVSVHFLSLLLVRRPWPHIDERCPGQPREVAPTEIHVVSLFQ